MTTNRLTQLKEMLAEDPDDSFLLFAIAKEYEGLEQYEEAIKGFVTLVEKDAAYVGTYYHLAKLYEEMEDADNALATYEAGILMAQKMKDLHALSELKNAKLNFELEQ